MLPQITKKSSACMKIMQLTTQHNFSYLGLEVNWGMLYRPLNHLMNEHEIFTSC